MPFKGTAPYGNRGREVKRGTWNLAMCERTSSLIVVNQSLSRWAKRGWESDRTQIHALPVGPSVSSGLPMERVTASFTFTGDKQARIALAQKQRARLTKSGALTADEYWRLRTDFIGCS